MTVSRVLNNPSAVSPDTRSRVEAAIADLDYVPNLLGQGLRHKRTNSLGLVLNDIRNPFLSPVIESVEEVASRHGFDVLLANSQSSGDRELQQLRSLVSRQVDGIVLAPVYNTPESVAFVQGQGVPIAVLGYQMPDNNVDVVRCDTGSAAEELTSYLIDQGHRKLAMITGPQAIVTATERAAGFEAALRRAGLSKRANPVVYGEFDPVVGRNLALAMLQSENRPTALVTANNFIALGAAHAAKDLGLDVPRDLSIVTFDGPMADYVLDPFFTCISQPAADMGERAAAMMFEQLSGKAGGAARDVLLPTRLDLHTSVAPPSST